VPFTIAHPAAAVLLAKPLGRLGVLSALVIGSISPDLPYFLPLPVSRPASHSLAGLVWFCLPVGLAGYWVFHLALKRPLCALLPPALQARLHPLVDERSGRTPARWDALVVSILLGALTHVGWDSFTHAGAPGVRAFPVLDQLLFTVWRYDVFVYKLLQHGSTIAGSLLLAWWTARWFLRSPEHPAAPAPALSPRVRLAIVSLLIVTACLAAGMASAEHFPVRARLGAIQRFAVHAVLAGLSSLSAGIFVYCAAWHACQVRRPRNGRSRDTRA